MEKKDIGIIGFGGQAREATEYLSEKNIKPAFFAIGKEYIQDGIERKIDILDPSEYQRLTPVIAAIGAPEIRRKLVGEWKGEDFSTIISEQAYVGESVEIGKGSIVAPRVVLTANVTVGEHSIINVGSTISHDCKLGNFTTVSPGAHIAGNVELGDGVFIGIGAVVSNGVRIAEGVVVGAGAVVLKDIEEKNATVVGVPAKVIRINEGWLSEV